MRADMQVKQFVAVVRGQFGRFAVFETGDASSYLFWQLDPKGCFTTLSWPVRKRDLQPKVRAMLRAGRGNAGFGPDDRQAVTP